MRLWTGTAIPLDHHFTLHRLQDHLLVGVALVSKLTDGLEGVYFPHLYDSFYYRGSDRTGSLL